MGDTKKLSVSITNSCLNQLMTLVLLNLFESSSHSNLQALN